jgi:hypothetical protein
MANVSLPYTTTFDDGDTAVGTQVIANMNAIVNVVNGNIEAVNVKDNSITDVKLQTISTAGKVSMAAVTGRAAQNNLPLIGQAQADITLTDEAGHIFDASTGNCFIMTATADRTLGTPTNPVANQRIIIKFKASGAARTLTLPVATSGDFRYGSDITTLTQTASGKIDYIGCIYNGTDSRWDVVAFVKGY